MPAGDVRLTLCGWLLAEFCWRPSSRPPQQLVNRSGRFRATYRPDLVHQLAIESSRTLNATEANTHNGLKLPEYNILVIEYELLRRALGTAFCCNALLGMTCDKHPKLLSAALSC